MKWRDSGQFRDRLRDWELRLVDWANVVRGKSYVWGKTDCGSLARQVLETMFGVDPTAAWLPPWEDSRSALRSLAYVDGLSGVFTMLGGEPQPITRMQNGALIVEDEDSDAFALSVYVYPTVIRTHPNTGVVWTKPNTVDPAGTCYNLWRIPVRELIANG